MSNAEEIYASTIGETLWVQDYLKAANDDAGEAFMMAQNDVDGALASIKEEAEKLLGRDEADKLTFGTPRFIETDSGSPYTAAAKFFIDVKGPRSTVESLFDEIGFPDTGLDELSDWWDDPEIGESAGPRI